MPMQDSGRSGQMRILIVEDEPLLAALVCDVLTDAGHEVVGIASTFRSAYAQAERVRPDLALVDIQLAAGDDGIEVARALRAGLGVRSILVSSDGLSARSNRDSAVGYLAKPWRPDALRESIDAATVILLGEPPSCVPADLDLFYCPRPTAAAA